MDINFANFPERKWEKEEKESFLFYKCPACENSFFSEEAVHRCIYCGSHMLMPCDNESLMPEGIIPFGIDKKQAIDALKGFCRGKKLLPKDFRELDFEKGIKGVYVPLWVLEGEGFARSSFNALRIEDFKRGKVEGLKKDFYTLKREGELSFDSCVLKTHRTHGFIGDIEPYYFSEAKPFNADYLKGFFVDKFDADGKEAYTSICNALEKTVNEEYKRDMTGFSGIKAFETELSLKNEKLKYILVPVWLMNYKYEGKIYSFAINGQTGAFTGKAPVGKGEYLRYFLTYFGIIAAIGIVVGLLI